MSYIGENEYFSFRDGFCEAAAGKTISTAEAARLGRIAARGAERFAVGSDAFAHNHIIYAICSGIAESGKDVYLCENTDLPSFGFGYPLISADCGIYISGESSLKISFFGRDGIPFDDGELSGIMNGTPLPSAEKCGKICSSTSFRRIYVSNIKGSLPNDIFPIKAGISCSNRSVRSLWNEFFTGDDDELVFQVSDNGQKVCALTLSHGVISHEKLMIAYAVLLARKGQAVWIPDHIHYAAEELLRGNDGKICRFSNGKKLPPSAVKQRFIADPLYMCVQLASERERFFEVLNEVNTLSTIRHDIAVTINSDIPIGKTISENGGRIMITRSGKSRISLIAQACSAETAAEICGVWTDKLRRLSFFGSSEGKSSDLTES